jgi:predicted nucleotidyltransferase
MRIFADRVPATLADKLEVLVACLQAFARVRPVHEVILFGSQARGTPRRDSDVDLCIVADGCEAQDQAAVDFRRAIGPLRGKPPLTLLPITPKRLEEKRRARDPFFATILREGIRLAEKD